MTSYRLRLVRYENRPDGGRDEQVEIDLQGDARRMVEWIFSAALTVTEGDPVAREQLRRLCVVHLGKA